MLFDELVEVIETLKERIQTQRQAIGTSERQTRASLVDPFLQALGWDIGDPALVTQEYKVDIGIKSNEQVDYALLQDGQPVVLLEAKRANTVLNNDSHLSQLYRYFTPSSARVGILTNGIQYRFYSDVERDNVMDTKPFLQLDVTNLSTTDKDILVCFSKDKLNLHNAIRLSEEETYKTRIVDRLTSACRNPDESFISWIMGETFEGKRTQDRKEWFLGLLREALKDFSVADSTDKTSTFVVGEGKSQRSSNLVADADIVKQSPEISHATPPEDWTSLIKYVAGKGASPPSEIRFKNGQERPLGRWNRVIIEVAEYLVRNKHLTSEECPIPAGTGSRRNLINNEARHSTGSKFHVAKTLSNGLFVDLNYSSSDCIKMSRFLLEHCGEDPSRVWLKTG